MDRVNPISNFEMPGDPELRPHYLFKFGKVEERIEVEDLQQSGGRPIHTFAIERAQNLSPPPNAVFFIEPKRLASGQIHHAREIVFQTHSELTPIAPAQDLPLLEAINNFMDVAFPGGVDEVFWRGPGGTNAAIRDLKKAYFRDHPEKLPHRGQTIN